jgi:hypothetical protein
MNTIYLNNTIETWVFAFFIIISFIVAGKLVYWGIQKTFKQYAQKTANDLDFILVDMLEEPLSLAIMLIGAWLALDVLSIQEGVQKFIDSILYFVIVFNVAWFVTRLFNALVEKYIAPKVKDSDTDLDDILLPIIKRLITIFIWVITVIIAVDNRQMGLMSKEMDIFIKHIRSSRYKETISD